MYFSLFPLETYGGIYKSCQARSEMTKKKKIVLYNITRGHLRQGGKTENPTLADFYYLFSSGLDLLSTYTQK